VVGDVNCPLVCNDSFAYDGGYMVCMAIHRWVHVDNRFWCMVISKFDTKVDGTIAIMQVFLLAWTSETHTLTNQIGHFSSTFVSWRVRLGVSF